MVNFRSTLGTILEKSLAGLEKSLVRMCPVCRLPLKGKGANLCEVCHAHLEAIVDPCQLCGEPNTADQLCGRCQKTPPPWQRLFVTWHFDGVARHLIHRFKYEQNLAAGSTLVSLASARFQFPDVDAIAAVPMHYRKLAKKGANHAHWLAKEFSRTSSQPLWQGLARTKATPALEGLNKKERRATLEQAFTLRSEPPERLALIDDVYTTGSTLTEAVTTLKKHGCKHVEVIVLARTPLGSQRR